MGVQTIKFKLVEVKAINGSEHFVEGFISTSDPDLFDDVVTPEAQKRILSQLVNQDITMDLDHEVWRDKKTGKEFPRPQNKIPVAKIVQAELRELQDGGVGTWIKAKLNKNYPLFDEVLNSIREGFLHSFSIAYNVLDKVFESVGPKVLRIIKDLVVFNIGFTGIPVNPNARFQLALKSLCSKMVDENTNNQELKTQDPQSNLEEENKRLKADLKTAHGDLEALREKKKTERKSLEQSQVESEAKFSELKSEVDKISILETEVSTLKTESAEFKSILEEIKNTPIKGAEMKSVNSQEVNTVSEISFKPLMGGQY